MGDTSDQDKQHGQKQKSEIVNFAGWLDFFLDALDNKEFPEHADDEQSHTDYTRRLPWS